MFNIFFIFVMWFFHNSIRFKVNKYWQDVARHPANLICHWMKSYSFIFMKKDSKIT